MSGREMEPRREWRAGLSRHRRTLLGAYVSLLGLLLLGLAVAPTRERLLTGIEAAVDAWESRWSPRVEHGEELVATGRYEEAVDYLERLDRQFPARDVRHARDRERERILRALGRAYAALDRQGRALGAFARAVEFDPLDYRNRLELARAAARFGDTDVAQRQFREILAMRPSHLPSLQAVVAHLYDEADYEGVVRVFEDYLGAFVVHHLVVRLGTGADTVPVQVDGRFHDVVARFSRPVGPARTLTLAPGPYAAELGSLTLEGGDEVGRADRPTPSLSESGRWTTRTALVRSDREAEELPTGETVGSSPTGERLVVELGEAPPDIVTATLHLRLLKPIDLPTWSLVEASYRNLLDFAGLTGARRRSFLADPPPSENR